MRVVRCKNWHVSRLSSSAVKKVGYFTERVFRTVPSDVVMGKGVEIKLNSVSRQKGGGANKARFSPVLLVAKLDLPQISKARTICAEDDTKSDIMSEDSEDQGKILLGLRHTCLANSCCVRILQFAAFDIQ